MSIMRVENLGCSFDQKILFNDLTFSIQQGDALGLVGRNGSGKTTLLKCIAGVQSYQQGSITTPKGVTVAYLPQEVVLHSNHTVLEETMKTHGSLGKAYITLQTYEIDKKNHDADYAHAYSMYVSEEGPLKLVEAQKVLQGLGFDEEGWNKPVSMLSVGWQMRVVLAKLLLQKADLYLFDEPTNHLDLPSQEWFCTFLQESSSAYILISHDTHLLRAACKKTLEITRQSLHIYHGNYDYYREEKAKRTAVHAQAYELQQKEIARKKQTIARFKANANKARMAQSMQKELDKMELITPPESEEKTLAMPFIPLLSSGTEVITAHNVSKKYERTLFSELSFSIKRGERVAVVAPNGKGKTTLLSILAGTLSPDTGTVKYGHKVHTALFEQEQVRVLNPEKTILEEAESAATVQMRPMIRGMLGAFLFSGDEVYKKTKVLSGGERNRLAMAKVLLQQANLLFLDEPTNHLDIPSKEMLLEALKAYQGTIIFVSHDHDFVSQLATSVLGFEFAGVVYYPGGYESYLYNRKQLNNSTSLQQETVYQLPLSSSKAKDSSLTGNEIYELRKKQRAYEQKIEKWEQKKREYEYALGRYEYGTSLYTEAHQEYEKIEKELTSLFTQWEEVVMQLEGK